MPTPTVYVVCATNCRYEGMTREQIIEAIAEATGHTPTDVDDAFITKIKELNANNQLKFWVGTTAEFNAVATKDAETLYILSDDDSADSWDDIAAELTAMRDELDNIIEGTQTVGHAALADMATAANSAATTAFTNNVPWLSVSVNSTIADNAVFEPNKTYQARFTIELDEIDYAINVPPFTIWNTDVDQIIATYNQLEPLAGTINHWQVIVFLQRVLIDGVFKFKLIIRKQHSNAIEHPITNVSYRELT